MLSSGTACSTHQDDFYLLYLLHHVWTLVTVESTHFVSHLIPIIRSPNHYDHVPFKPKKKNQTGGLHAIKLFTCMLIKCNKANPIWNYWLRFISLISLFSTTRGSRCAWQSENGGRIKTKKTCLVNTAFIRFTRSHLLLTLKFSTSWVITAWSIIDYRVWLQCSTYEWGKNSCISSNL